MSKHLLILPRLRVQNANCISSSMTWGFPSITAFTGFMVALQRKLGAGFGLQFESVGVVCHGFEAQVTQGGYTRSFHLTRNPVLQDGSTAAIVEEGRAHLDITLVFTVQSSAAYLGDEALQSMADAVGEHVAGMRIAGGSVMPALAHLPAWRRKPRLVQLSTDDEGRAKQFRQLRRQWLPGFALVSRHDVLTKRLETLQAEYTQRQAQAQAQADAKGNTATPTHMLTASPTLLDAWLDLSRLNVRASYGDKGQVQWQADKRPGWLVPMPVGYAALSELHAAGTVANARDPRTPFRLVEALYSMGQWISPHRLLDAQHFMWKVDEYNESLGLYRCVNHYPAPAEEEPADEPASPDADDDSAATDADPSDAVANHNPLVSLFD